MVFESIENKVDALFHQEKSEQKKIDVSPKIEQNYVEPVKKGLHYYLISFVTAIFGIIVCYLLYQWIGLWTIFIGLLFVVYISRRESFSLWAPRILIAGFVCFVCYTLYGFFGIWIIVAVIISLLFTVPYTFLVHKIPCIVAVDNIHIKDSTDKFGIFAVPVSLWFKMHKNGQENPLESETGLVYFTEGIDFENKVVNMSYRHYNNTDFDTKKNVFFDLKNDFIVNEKVVDRQRLLKDVAVHGELKTRLNYVLDTLDNTLFKDRSKIEENEILRQIEELREQLKVRNEEVLPDVEKKEEVVKTVVKGVPEV